MDYILNKLALFLFDIVGSQKGYRFKKASTDTELDAANRIYEEQAFSFPTHLEAEIQKYKAGTVNFVAYYNNAPVGMVRLANPKVINRAYELYGLDIAGEHYEIQSLVVKQGHRDGAQFVMLGLVKELYVYSIANSILSWSGCGVKGVYLTIRRYCKKSEVIDVDFKKINNPITQYLYANSIVETYFTMEVASFEPWQIFKKFIKKSAKKWAVTEFIRTAIEDSEVYKKLCLK